VLTDLEPLTYADVGTRLGISLAAVKSRVLRGRVQLHDAFERLCGEKERPGLVELLPII
jgi:DNA-directed RNA polymerase specialized sigma24 family protein